MTPITPQDVNKYITTIRINFENAYKTQSDEEREILIRSWYAILKEYPKEIVDKAVINAIKNAEFAPRIGTIVKEIDKMREAFEKSENELWAELTGVLRKVSDNVYNYRFNAIAANGLTQGENAYNSNKEIFNNLSPELKDYCRNLSGLVSIAEYTDEQLSYERGRFMRVMPQVKERARVRQSTPDGLARLVQGLSEHLSLDCVNTKLLKGD